MPLASIVPPFQGLRPKQADALARQLLFPVNVRRQRQFYLSVRSGVLLEPEVGARARGGGRAGARCGCSAQDVGALLCWLPRGAVAGARTHAPRAAGVCQHFERHIQA